MNNNYFTEIFETPFETAKAVAAKFNELTCKYIKEKDIVNSALSGGKTPELFFDVLSNDYFNISYPEKINFYWVDERCVPPESSESNFGEAYRKMFSRFPSVKNLYRIKGEDNPEVAAENYADLLKKNLPIKNGIPVFDIICLGLGDDGHTASIFPGNDELLTTDKICAVSLNPYNGQKRITLTVEVINNAHNIIFFVTGKNKAETVRDILMKKNNYEKLPASHINPSEGNLYWYLDSDAASLIDINYFKNLRIQNSNEDTCM